MRVVIAFILSSVSLAACDAPVTPAPAVEQAAADASVAALKDAGERECSELTNYSPETLKAMTPEMQALRTREFKSCVDAVTRGEAPPSLRGRS